MRRRCAYVRGCTTVHKLCDRFFVPLSIVLPHGFLVTLTGEKNSKRILDPTGSDRISKHGLKWLEMHFKLGRSQQGEGVLS